MNAIAEEVSKFTNTAMETRQAVKPSNMTKLLFSYSWTPTAPNDNISFLSIQTGKDKYHINYFFILQMNFLNIKVLIEYLR